MAVNYFILLISVSLVAGLEEFTVQYAPNSISFTPGKPVEISYLADIYSSILGFTTKGTSWDGVKVVNPFQRPEAILVIELDGFQTIDANLDGKKFPLISNVDPVWPYQQIADRVFVHFPDKNPVLVELDSNNLYSLRYQYPELFSSLLSPFDMADKVKGPSSFMPQNQLNHLNTTFPSHVEFLRDMQILIDISDAVFSHCKRVHDGIPDIYWIQLSGFKTLVNSPDVDQEAVEEAQKIIKQTLQKVQVKFLECYGENLLMTVATTSYEEPTLVRRTRQAKQPAADGDDMNLATGYPDTYSASFIIIFFTMLLFVLAVFAVALGIWNMDPGRDSIIYRMTSTRMKRD